MRRLFFAFCLMLSPLLGYAQETQTLPEVSDDSQLFNLSIDLKVQDGTSEKLVSDHKVQHLTVSGKPVTLNIKGGNFKAAVRLTLYRMQDDNLLLLTQSSIFFINEGRRQMLSTAQSIPVKAGEKVLFFPLGVLNDGNKSGYNCMLEMNISKYQQQPVSQE